MPSYSITLYAKWLEKDLIVNGTGGPIDVNCNSEYYDFCQGSVITTRSITKLVTTVSLNPNSRTGLHVKNELTWTEPPTYSVKDFSGIGYHPVYVDSNRETIEAEIRVYYHDYEGIYDISYDNYYYSNQDHKYMFEIDPNGAIIWNIEKVYINGFINGHPSGPAIFKDGEAVMPFYIDTVVYTLENDFDLLGDYASYNNLNKLPFWGDYRHTYPDVNFSFDGLTLRAYYDKIQVFLGVKITPTISADSSRKNDIEIYF